MILAVYIGNEVFRSVRSGGEKVLSSQVEEPHKKKSGARLYRSPCGRTIESRTHMVGECEIYKEG